MEDTRSPHCIRTEEHQRYKRDERGMGLEEFTNELCVWRPNWTNEPNGDALVRRDGNAAISTVQGTVAEPASSNGAELCCTW